MGSVATPPPVDASMSGGGSDAPEQDSWASAADAASSPGATEPTPTWGDARAAGAAQDAASKETAPVVNNEKIPGVETPAPDLPAPEPPVVTSQKPGGIAGVMQSILGALVGKTKPEIGTDQYGNKYVKQTTLSGGEQWMRLAGEALHGAAAGWAAGKGAGNMGNAALAGVDAGDKIAQQRQQQQKDMTAEARQQNLDQANALQQRMNLADQALRTTRLGQEVDENTQKAADGLASTYKAAGGEVSGHVNDLKEAAAYLKTTPEHWAQLIQQHRVGYVPTYTTDPKTGRSVADGFDIYLMPAEYRGEVMPAGTEFHHPDPTDPTKLVTYHTSEPTTRGWVTDQNSSAIAASTKAQADKTEAARQAQMDADKEKDEASKRKLEGAQTTEAYAGAQEKIAQANKLTNPTPDDPKIKNLGEEIANGKMTEDQMGKLDKGTLTAVQDYLSTAHPNLDQKSVFLDSGQRKQVNLANNALDNLGQIQEILQRRPDLLGVINGRISQGKELAGTDDKDLAAVNTMLDNYALASTGAHGIRAVQARADAKKALLNGFKNGPQGVQASIGAARMSLTNLASAGKPRTVDGNPYVPGQAASSTPPPAAPAGVPVGAQPAYLNNKLVGYKDASGVYHSLGG